MKTIHYFIIFLFLLLASVLPGRAQTTFSFIYDASGNRTDRIIPLKSAHITSQDTLAGQQKTFEDLIGNRKVKIYPNPTKGRLKIEIPFTEDLTASLKVFSIQGALVSDQEVTDTFMEIDLSSQPPGMYVLKISVGELSSEWKIIKN